MGRPTHADRGNLDRGTDNRYALVDRVSALPPPWSVLGDGSVPEALSDALETDLALNEELEGGSIDRIAMLAARLIADWEFLLEAQSRAARDPKDQALLITDPLSDFARTSFQTELHQTKLGPAIPIIKSEKGPDRSVWQPKSFPKGMSIEAQNAYPRRPRHVGEIPPFHPVKVKRWRELARKNVPQLTLVDATKIPSKKLSTADLKKLDNALARAFDRLGRKLVDIQVDAVTGGATPNIDRARKNLSLVSLADIVQQTNAKIAVPDRDPLLNQTELMLFHGASFSFLLDKNGRPTNLNGLFDYALLEPAAGSQMYRSVPPPGLYVSIQRYGFNTFLIDGSTISKVLFGGIGGFSERTLHVTSEHEYHLRLQNHILNMSRMYVAGISVDAALRPNELTIDRVEERIPLIVVRALPFTLAVIERRAKAIRSDYSRVAKEIGLEIVKQLLVEEIKERVKDFLVKRVGTKIIPFVNLASTVYDWIHDADERRRIRYAIGCMIVAIGGKSEDEMTLSANVLGEIMAEQFGDAVMSAVVARGMAMTKKALHPHGDAPSKHAPAQEPTPADTPAHAPGDSRTTAPVKDPTTVTHVKDPTAAVSPVEAAKHPAAPPSITGNNLGQSHLTISKKEPEKQGEDSGSAQMIHDEHKKPKDPRGTLDKKTDEDARATNMQPQKVGATGGIAEASASRSDEPRFRVGIDEIRGDNTPAAPPGTDGVGIHRVGVDTIGVSERTGEARDLGKRALEKEGRPTVPENTGTPMGFQTQIGRPQRVDIGGAIVSSRNPNVLLGWNKEHHREDVAKVVAADPNHPMRPMLDESSAGSNKPKFVDPDYEHGNMESWERHPEDWQSGHARSEKAGDADVLVVQTRARNQRQSNIHENPKTGAGDVTMDKAVVIGGIAVERTSAWDLWERGFINLSYEQMTRLPTIDL